MLVRYDVTARTRRVAPVGGEYRKIYVMGLNELEEQRRRAMREGTQKCWGPKIKHESISFEPVEEDRLPLKL